VPPCIFMHGTDIVDKGLIVLFLVFFWLFWLFFRCTLPPGNFSADALLHEISGIEAGDAEDTAASPSKFFRQIWEKFRRNLDKLIKIWIKFD